MAWHGARQSKFHHADIFHAFSLDRIGCMSVQVTIRKCVRMDWYPASSGTNGWMYEWMNRWMYVESRDSQQWGNDKTSHLLPPPCADAETWLECACQNEHHSKIHIQIENCRIFQVVVPVSFLLHILFLRDVYFFFGCCCWQECDGRLRYHRMRLAGMLIESVPEWRSMQRDRQQCDWCGNNHQSTGRKMAMQMPERIYGTDVRNICVRG